MIRSSSIHTVIAAWLDASKNGVCMNRSGRGNVLGNECCRALYKVNASLTFTSTVSSSVRTSVACSHQHGFRERFIFNAMCHLAKLATQMNTIDATELDTTIHPWPTKMSRRLSSKIKVASPMYQTKPNQSIILQRT